MFFTDAEDRHQQQLIAELSLQVQPTYEAQRRLRERYERRKNPDHLLIPGEERHDA